MALNLIIMGFLTSLIGPVVGAVIGGAFGKNSAKTDYKYQLKLMNKQQKYARENAATSNEYARQNALDAPLLQKLGKQQAGINTAFGENGSVSSVGSGAMASAPNIPSPMGIGNSVASLSNAIGNNFSAVSQAVLQQEQAKKAASERQQVDIDNLSRAAENLARIDKYGSESAKANAEASFIDLQNRFKQATWDSDVSLSNSNATIQEANADTQYDMNMARLYSELASSYERIQSGDLSKQQIETEKQKIKNLKQEIIESKSRVDLNKSQKDVNISIIDLNKVNQKAQEIQNLINGNDKVVKAAITRLVNSARVAGPQSFSDYAWSVFNDPHATTAQKWKAAGASILGWVERSLGGSSSLPQYVYDDVKTLVDKTSHKVRETVRPKPGKNRVPVWKRR